MTKKENLEHLINMYQSEIKGLNDKIHNAEQEINKYRQKVYDAQTELHQLKLDECKKYFDFETDIKDFADGKIEVVFDNDKDQKQFYDALKVLNAFSVACGNSSLAKDYNGREIKFNSINNPNRKIEKIIKYKPFDKVYYNE